MGKMSMKEWVEANCAMEPGDEDFWAIGPDSLLSRRSSNALSTSALTAPSLRNAAAMANIATRAEVERDCAENLERAVEALKTERRKADAYGLFGLYQTRFPDPREEIDRLNEVVVRYRDLAGSLGDKLDAAEKELARLRDLLLVMSRRGFGLDQNATDEEQA